MIRAALRPCPICKHRQVEVLHSQRFALPEGHPLADGYDVVCCKGCGFVYADVTTSQEAYNRFYSQHSKYEDQATSTGGGASPWDRRRLDEAALRITGVLNNPEASVLDVGCANGGFLKALQDRGYWHLMGIDPSPACVEHTRQLGIAAQVGSFSSAPPRNAFDLIVLSHILEHVQDLQGAARWIEGALGIDRAGWLYVEVPDATRYKDYVFSPFQDFNTEHINHFSQLCLGNFLRISGFEPLDSGDELVESAPHMDYPIIYSFAKRGVGPLPGGIKRDAMLKQHTLQYIELSRQVLNRINERLRPVLASGSQVIVWGTGQLVMKLLIDASLSQASIVAFVDSNPANQGKILRGLPVISPGDVIGFPGPIVIGTILHQESVREQVREMGLANQLVLLG